MPSAIAMPKLGMAMKEGTVLAWLAQPGDAVAKGQIVLRIESEKTEVDVESPASGVLRHVYVAPDTVVPCGTFLAAITEGAADPFDAEAFRKENERAEIAPKKPAPPARSAGATGTSLPHPAEPPVVPAARKRAKDLDVDLARVIGSGPNGRVTVEDVEAYAAQIGERIEVAPGVRLEAPCEGAGEPLLLLPGFGTHVSAFGHQASALARSHRVRGVNPRGIGFSSAPASDVYDVPTAAADVAAVAGGPAHLVGASLGAAVALELALTRPELVRSLVLITPFARATPRLLAVLDAWARLAAEATPDVLAAALLPWLYGQDLLGDTQACRRTLRALAEMSAHAPATTLRRQEAGLRAWSGTRAGDLGRVRARTLVIAAEDDLLAPDGPELAQAIPGAILARVPRAGHAVSVDAAETVTQAIAAHVGDG